MEIPIMKIILYKQIFINIIFKIIYKFNYNYINKLYGNLMIFYNYSKKLFELNEVLLKNIYILKKSK